MNDKTPKNVNDQHLDDFLEQSIPDADEATKQQSIQMASAEFDKVFAENHQASSATARPIDKHRNTSVTKTRWLSGLTQSIRSFFMNTNNNPFAYKAFGSIAVAFLAVSAVIILPSTQTITEVKDVASTSQPQFEQPKKAEPSVSLQVDRDSDARQTSSPDANTPVERMVEAEERVVRKREPLREQIQQGTKPQLDDYASAPQPAPYVAADLNTRATAKVASVPSQLVKEFNQPPIITNHSTEEYAEYDANSIKLVVDEPVSTFSIDVDTASYSLVRNQLMNGYLPKPQAVRAEEFINYFNYDYPAPRSKKKPFEPSVSVLDSPWNQDKKLVHIGIKGYDIDSSEQPDSNIVFLLDVSGSMNANNKLPLVKQSISLLLDTLKDTDKVSIVVYAGAAGTVLEPTQAKDKSTILQALQRLSAGGSTAGGAGIKLAYQLAEQNFDKDAVNRIILATDGDFNVGQSSNEDLKTLVERKRSNGVFLSVLGFGRNNYQDDMMQTLAQNGNGVAAYIDSLSEAKKVLVDEATSTLFPIAKDVKIQIEFNPATVSEYRLVGYETRALNREDFNNDKVDAGDIGAGHTVTAIYEITPATAANKSIDEPRYADNKTDIVTTNNSNEYGFLKIRYKLPNSDTSILLEEAITVSSNDINNQDSNFSIAVASFAQLLSNNQHTGKLSYQDIIKQANANKGNDPFGYRAEFIQLVRMAEIAKP